MLVAVCKLIYKYFKNNCILFGSTKISRIFVEEITAKTNQNDNS